MAPQCSRHSPSSSFSVIFSRSLPQQARSKHGQSQLLPNENSSHPDAGVGEFCHQRPRLQHRQDGGGNPGEFSEMKSRRVLKSMQFTTLSAHHSVCFQAPMPCVFPFTFLNESYKACTDVRDPEGKFWYQLVPNADLDETLFVNWKVLHRSG